MIHAVAQAGLSLLPQLSGDISTEVPPYFLRFFIFCSDIVVWSRHIGGAFVVICPLFRGFRGVFLCFGHCFEEIVAADTYPCIYVRSFGVSMRFIGIYSSLCQQFPLSRKVQSIRGFPFFFRGLLF